MNYIVNELSKKQKIYWNKKIFYNDSVKISFIDYPQSIDNMVIDKERMRRIDNKIHLFNISTPIYNKRRDLAMIQQTNVYCFL